MKAGLIYKITVRNTKYFLVGSTINKLSIRKFQYFTKLKAGNYSNKLLQRVFNKYGKESFIFEILQNNISEDILEHVEDIWIGALCSRIEDKNGGMNIRDAKRPRWSEMTKKKISKSRKGKMMGKDNWMFGKPMSKEHKEKISHTKRGYKILQYSLNGDFIKEWESVKEITEKLRFSEKGIYKCMRNFINQAYGFIWRYKENTSILLKIKPYLFKRDNSWRKYPIYEINKYGKLVKEWKNTKEFSKYIGVNQKTIQRALNKKINNVAKYKNFYFTKILDNEKNSK